MVEIKAPSQLFGVGDKVLIQDKRGRHYLITLALSKKFESHIGAFPHEDLIGQEDGAWVTTNKGHVLLAVKPTMAEYVVEMPRIATVSYPKDTGAILVYGDIFPGARVLEAGSGSGALTMNLLRAVGEHGRVYSYDLREDMLARAQKNVESMLGDAPNVEFKQGDVYQGIDEDDLDRVVLDLPEPWQVVPHASDKLARGGLFVSFLPTVLQIHELTNALREQRTFEMIETFEVLMRPWAVSGRSVRPSHRMVGHTGFITTARRCAPRPYPSALQEEAPETEETTD
ncbi:MAG: hypothetical protein BZY79_03350 [SAR202 cluster bacterium Casp-Chloro-G4]|nr:tRNA (adenine-N1)-methyltransferase [Chloroflexota bacterium]PKB61519.1 MAG: hypothetical protein BZY79_03350 [SAR202 cluster bacterium Casp-Chloro-G4]